MQIGQYVKYSNEYEHQNEIGQYDEFRRDWSI